MLIKENYDLSNGNTESNEVLVPNNWRVTATTSNIPEGYAVDIEFYVAGENGQYAPLTDEKDRHIKLTINKNTTASINLSGVNAAKGKVKIVVQENAQGLIDIDSINN